MLLCAARPFGWAESHVKEQGGSKGKEAPSDVPTRFGPDDSASAFRVPPARCALPEKLLFGVWWLSLAFFLSIFVQPLGPFSVSSLASGAICPAGQAAAMPGMISVADHAGVFRLCFPPLPRSCPAASRTLVGCSTDWREKHSPQQHVFFPSVVKMHMLSQARFRTYIYVDLVPWAAKRP